jgi:hypothetical protein
LQSGLRNRENHRPSAAPVTAQSTDTKALNQRFMPRSLVEGSSEEINFASAKNSVVAQTAHVSEYFLVSVAELPIQIDREQIARFCQERGVRRLSLFGSELLDDFDPQRSEVDVLAEFEPDALKGVGFRHFGYGEALAAIVGHKVDFCSCLNKYIEAAVRREAIPIYERA